MAIITHPATLRWLTSLPLRGKEVRESQQTKKSRLNRDFVSFKKSFLE